MSLDEKERYLRQTHTFRSLSDGQIAQLGRFMTIKRYQAQTTMIVSGEEVDAERDGLYIIVEGRADVCLDDTDPPQTVQLLGRGDIFGELAVTTGSRRCATVSATGPTTVLLLSVATYRHLRENHIELALALHDCLFEGLMQHQIRSNELARLHGVRALRRRLLILLPLLARPWPNQAGASIIDQVKVSEIATLLGVHRSSVSDILRKLQAKGLIQMQRSKQIRIIIPDLARLQKETKAHAEGEEGDMSLTDKDLQREVGGA